MRALIVMLGLAGLVLAAPAMAQGDRFDRQGCDPDMCSESRWIYDDNATDHTTIWRHGLGVIPRRITILFSPDPDRGPVSPLAWSWQWERTGNPISVEMGRRAVRLHIIAEAPLHGIWRPRTGWRKFREGYWKIIVYR